MIAFVTLMDEGTVVNKEETIEPPVAEEPNDIFSSVSANDNNESAFNSLPSCLRPLKMKKKKSLLHSL